MPPSGIRITLELAGTSAERFRTQAAIPLLTSLHRQLDSEQRETFVASVTVVPAGSSGGGGSNAAARPTLRRALRQATPGQPVQLPKGPEWLEVVVIAGGPQPVEMYGAAEEALKCVPCALLCCAVRSAVLCCGLCFCPGTPAAAGSWCGDALTPAPPPFVLLCSALAGAQRCWAC